MDTNRLRKAFGAVLRRRRTAAGLTQEELAHRAGLSTTFISLIENGHRAPSIIVVRQLSTALGVPAAAIVQEWEREFGRAPKK